MMEFCRVKKVRKFGIETFYKVSNFLAILRSLRICNEKHGVSTLQISAEGALMRSGYGSNGSECTLNRGTSLDKVWLSINFHGANGDLPVNTH